MLREESYLVDAVHRELKVDPAVEETSIFTLQLGIMVRAHLNMIFFNEKVGDIREKAYICPAYLGLCELLPLRQPLRSRPAIWALN